MFDTLLLLFCHCFILLVFILIFVINLSCLIDLLLLSCFHLCCLLFLSNLLSFITQLHDYCTVGYSSSVTITSNSSSLIANPYLSSSVSLFIYYSMNYFKNLSFFILLSISELIFVVANCHFLSLNYYFILSAISISSIIVCLHLSFILLMTLFSSIGYFSHLSNSRFVVSDLQDRSNLNLTSHFDDQLENLIHFLMFSSIFHTSSCIYLFPLLAYHSQIISLYFSVQFI